MSNTEIIEDINRIADGITQEQIIGRGLTVSHAQEMRVKALEVAGKIVQSRIIANELLNISRKFYR